MRICVIIPTYQDWSNLQLCLHALMAQSLPQSAFDIIVANNDPVNPCPDDLTLPENCQMINVAEPGSYAARNAALRHTQAKILAFTDADCIPDPAWLAEALGFFNDNPDVLRLAGRIQHFVEDGVWTAAALYDRTYMLQQQKFAAEGKAATANAFMRREVFDAVGLFNPNLLTGGDHEWSLRAERAGFRIIYHDKATVRHPARSSFSQLRRKARRFAGGNITKRRLQGQRFIIPQFDNLLLPIRRGILLLRSDDLTTWQAIRVWVVLYAIRISVVGEQLRLIIFRGQPERR